MTESIDLSLGLWTRVGRKKHKFIVFARRRHCVQFQLYLPGGDNVPDNTLPWLCTKMAEQIDLLFGL